ncbi:hypothetical protein NQ271_26780, partial [Escherichia coli]|nr:hypothetical protein [Escherichia coli]
MADGAATEQRPLLGLIDRTAEVFMAMRLPFELEKTGKRITSIAFRGDTLVVVDEHVDPKEILTYDIR